MALSEAQIEARFNRVMAFAIQQCHSNQQETLALFVRGVCELVMSVEGDDNKRKGIDLVVDYLHKVKSGEFGGFEPASQEQPRPAND